MYSKTELQLKGAKGRKGCVEKCDDKTDKTELELKKTESGEATTVGNALPTIGNALPTNGIALCTDGQMDKTELELKKTDSGEATTVGNALPTHGNVLSTDGQAITAIREKKKKMLQYRGKRPDGGWCGSASRSHSHSEEWERTESVTSGHFSSSDRSQSGMERNAKIESAIMEAREEDQFAPGLKPPAQNSPLFKKQRYCWYCYDVYKAMRLAQGREVPSVHTHGIWRGHCMKDKNHVTTCPHLWFVKCQNCGATAEDAHTARYCPMAPFSFRNPHNN